MPDQIEGSPTTVSHETDTSLGGSDSPSSLMDLYIASQAEFGSGDDEDTTEASDPAEGGHVERAEAATESGTEDNPIETPWDWQEFASKPVKVKVGGQETEIPLGELRNGYMRQADYTRKTQELAEAQRLAEWAEGFQRQLRDNPQHVLRTLAAAFQDDAATEVDPYEAELAKLVETDPELTPMARMLLEERRERMRLEQEMAAQAAHVQQRELSQQQRENIAAVEAEIASVTSKHPDFDADIALQIAAQKPGLNLEEAWVLYRALNPAPVSQETPPPAAPAPQPAPSNREAKERLAASTTNVRLQGKSDVPDDEYQTFEELFDIMSKTAQR